MSKCSLRIWENSGKFVDALSQTGEVFAPELAFQVDVGWGCGACPLFTPDKRVRGSSSGMPVTRILIAGLSAALVFDRNFGGGFRCSCWDKR